MQGKTFGQLWRLTFSGVSHINASDSVINGFPQGTAIGHTIFNQKANQRISVNSSAAMACNNRLVNSFLPDNNVGQCNKDISCIPFVTLLLKVIQLRNISTAFSVNNYNLKTTKNLMS